MSQLPSGKWRARHLGPDGHRHSATFTTKADADAWLAAQRTDEGRGAWVDPRLGRVSLAEWATDRLERRSDLRPTTRAKYRHLLDRHILPVLGRTELGRLTPSSVRSWYMALRAVHQVTADDAYRLLRAILNTAVADEVIVRNPCQVKGAGQVHSPERPTGTVAELAAAVQSVPDRYQLALLLTAWCQLRRGEVLGLQRRDVDLLHSSIRVERSWAVTTEGMQVLGDPKTEKGTRVLAVPSHVTPLLADHLDRLIDPSPAAWLFPGREEQPITPRTLDRMWERARRTVGRPDLRLHDVRHSGLTWAAASGASVAELMHRGGHASPAAALRYQHATADRDRAIADALAALAEPTETTPIAAAKRYVSRSVRTRGGHGTRSGDLDEGRPKERKAR
jgi:integrase